jgi:hypothetical protein
MVFTDIYSTFHPAAAQYAFFSVARGTFPKINGTLANIKKLKKLPIS